MMRSSVPTTTNRTTSRTGRKPGPRRPGHVTAPAGPSPGFTVIELLVVVGIIAILASVLIPVLFAARRSAYKKQAQKEISDIAGALTNYYVDRSEYPPDTANWQDLGDLFDVRSIHRNLGKTVTDEKGRPFGPYLAVKFKSLRAVEDGVGVYVDPWDNDYHFDAVHTQMVAGTPTRVGGPYREDTRVPKDQRTLDFKVVSFGPDGKTGLYYPFDPDMSNAETARIATDDIRSW